MREYDGKEREIQEDERDKKVLGMTVNRCE